VITQEAAARIGVLFDGMLGGGTVDKTQDPK
jgi:hypothetical protein